MGPRCQSGEGIANFASFSEAARQADLVFPNGFIEVLDAAVAAGVLAFLVEGEPGTGKTHLGRAWAEATGGNVIFSQANAWTSDEALVRGVDLAGFVERDPARVYAAGVLLKALRAAENGRPTIVILDEWDKTRPVADGLLLAALEERVLVDSAGTIHGHFPPTVAFWITSNATRPLADALVRRCLRLVFPRMAAAEARRLIMERGSAGLALAGALVNLRDRAKTTITLPDMIRVASILVRVRSVEAARVVAEGLLRGEQPRKDFRLGDDLWAALCRDRAEARP